MTSYVQNDLQKSDLLIRIEKKVKLANFNGTFHKVN